MEREHLQKLDVSWDHEPVRIPLNRPPGTFSPTGGEGWDEGVRFMENPHGQLAGHGDHEQGRDSSGAAVPAVFPGVSPATNLGARRPGGRRDACPTTTRFMERVRLFVVALALVCLEDVGRAELAAGS